MSTSLAPAVTTTHSPATYHQARVHTLLTNLMPAETNGLFCCMEPQLGLFISQHYRTPSVGQCIQIMFVDTQIMFVAQCLHNITTDSQLPVFYYCGGKIDMGWVLCLQEVTCWLDSWQLHPTLNRTRYMRTLMVVL